MRRKTGLAHMKTLLGVFAACILVFGLFSQPDAYDFARSLYPGFSGRKMCTSCGREDAAGHYDASWWCEGQRDCVWSCPQCGARDNIRWVEKCRRCAYSRKNPDGYLLRPVETTLITNEYSKGHRAVDFGAPRGSLVFAVEDGVVIEVRKDKWAGNVLRIQHSDGLQSLYGHLRESLVTKGCPVRMGEVVALSGSTGASTGPHLHFEVYINGETDNPLYYLEPW